VLGDHIEENASFVTVVDEQKRKIANFKWEYLHGWYEEPEGK
jgi:hypothetical protein